MTGPEPPSRMVVWRRPNQNLDDTRAPYSWAGWGRVYARRWQYWPPWGVTRWRLPRAVDACDGQRASKLLIAPPLGAFVWFFNRPCGHDDEDGED